jgi:hypothetical protein
MLTMATAVIAAGMGRHASTLSQDNVVRFREILLAAGIFYITAITLIKLSVLLMYRRLFPSRRFQIGLAVLALISILWWIAFTIVSIFQCQPVSKVWLPSAEGTCVDLKESALWNAISNIVIDVAILCMPIGQIWKLRLNLEQKLSLCFIFLLGSMYVLTLSPDGQVYEQCS